MLSAEGDRTVGTTHTGATGLHDHVASPSDVVRPNPAFHSGLVSEQRAPAAVASTGPADNATPSPSSPAAGAYANTTRALDPDERQPTVATVPTAGASGVASALAAAAAAQQAAAAAVAFVSKASMARMVSAGAESRFDARLGSTSVVGWGAVPPRAAGPPAVPPPHRPRAAASTSNPNGTSAALGATH